MTRDVLERLVEDDCSDLNCACCKQEELLRRIEGVLKQGGRGEIPGTHHSGRNENRIRSRTLSGSKVKGREEKGSDGPKFDTRAACSQTQIAGIDRIVSEGGGDRKGC